MVSIINNNNMFTDFYQFINEKYMHDIDVSDVVTDKFVKDFISINSDTYYQYYLNEKGLDEDEHDFDNIVNSKDYFLFVKNELKISFEKAQDEIYSSLDYINNNYFKIYREIHVDSKWVDNLSKNIKRLGIYWTYDKNRAEAYWGHDKSKNIVVTITAVIRENQVNWVETLQQNTDMYFSDEKEIRLFKNTPIQLIEILVDGEPLDLEDYGVENKLFKA